MITKLEFAKKVRLCMAAGCTALCLASQAVRRELYQCYTEEAQEMEDQFDAKVRAITVQYGGDMDAMFRWPNNEYGKQQRLAVCDHIINELEQA